MSFFKHFASPFHFDLKVPTLMEKFYISTSKKIRARGADQLLCKLPVTALHADKKEYTWKTRNLSTIWKIASARAQQRASGPNELLTAVARPLARSSFKKRAVFESFSSANVTS